MTLSRSLPALSFVAILALAVAGGPALAQPGRDDDDRNAARYGWLSDYARGKDLARKLGKPLMVVLRCFP